jgi:RNA polymerase sigma-70 factor (ECF subfamily)
MFRSRQIQPAMAAEPVMPSSGGSVSDAASDGGGARAAGASPDLLDEAGFARLHAQTARPLWSYLYRVVGDAAQAEDLVQETFLRVLRARIAALDDDERRAYVFRIAGNLAVDTFRKRKREGDVLATVERDHARDTPAQTRDLDVARSFGQLKPQERAMLWLAYVEGSAHDEIAQSLGVKSGSIRVLLFRARRKLRDLIAATGGSR